MSFKGSGVATELKEIDRFEAEDTAGVGWIAFPEEGMQRASHALAVDGEVWLVDPVDAEGLDDLVAEFGDVAGVVVLLDRHKRDAAAIANRHDVAVHLPEFMSGIADEFDAPVELFGRELADTGFTAYEVVDNFAWKEAALFHEGDGVLLVPEAVGTTDLFCTSSERLGVHPGLRLMPPKKLARLNPERILVGHGEGIHDDAAGALQEAVSRSRGRAPSLYLQNLKMFLPV
ncbi:MULTISPECIES: hypothetical protein [Salinibaculum]|uniref:hypothetical protein n=1 Tax=Salinibaculum TaxID=2732368 RepID=UPI0030CD8BAE